MKMSQWFPIVLLVVLCLSACTKETTPQTGQNETPETPSSVETPEKPETPAIPPKTYPERPNSDNLGESEPFLPLKDFTAKSAAEILTEQKNSVYSPLSFYLALSMLAELDPSDREILDALGVKEVNELRNYSQPLLEIECFKAENEAFLPANSMWMMKGRAILPELTEKLRASYDADLFDVDFSNVEETRGKLVQWIKEKTFDLIPNAEVDLDAQTRAILLNALYLKDSFLEPFSELTKESFEQPNFTDADGKTHTLTMLSSEGKPLPYYRTDNAEIAVKGMKYGMKAVFVRPSGKLSELLEEKSLKEILGAISKREDARFANVLLPKMNIKSKFRLDETAKKLGIRKAFSPSESTLRAYADTEDNLFISSILQEAVFKMDKDGIEAAAYTEINMKESSMMINNITELRFDRPFFYMVVNQANDPLFLGTYVTPDGQGE